MSEAKHTPGPWHWNEKHQLVGPLVPDDGYMEAHHPRIVETDGGFYPPTEADRHLIAAAPDLLEALAALMDAHAIPSSICKERSVYEKARAAIAKATGRPA